MDNRKYYKAGHFLENNILMVHNSEIINSLNEKFSGYTLNK